ncbi:MAG: phosphoribosylglycinamide formyltransferase [Acidimicrobiia bacterium]|nr:phosphoribosylglycinamide formyltransferase [Acidimicrobiia bacterium]
MKRLAVLASGSGTNLQAILDAASAPDYPVEIALVLSDRPGCRALERAAAAGVATEVVEWAAAGANRNAFTSVIVETLRAHGIDLVALAGFMRILSREAIDAFPNAILNTHPALLPAFKGAHACEDAIRAGVKVSGVTVHVVDVEVDAGPIIAQVAVEVRDDDTPQSLQERIKAVEHDLYPRVIAEWARGAWEVVDSRTRWRGRVPT